MADSNSPEDWKHAPPYQRPDVSTDERQSFDKKIKASCHCQRVKYWISREKPLQSKYCHCHDCQVLHGAPFQWTCTFHKTDVAFEDGVEHLIFYNSNEQSTNHDLPCKIKCSFCGSLIGDEGRNMILLHPTLFELSEEQKKHFEVE